MKIGTLTYHYSLNYGAALQCYALKEYLSKENETHVINYEDENQYRNSSMYSHGSGIKRIVYNILFLPFHGVRQRKKSRYEEFASNYFSLTNRVTNAKELKELINNEGFDIVIVGSDQVWNPNIKDFTKSYFLPFSFTAKKVAYATSIGNANPEDLQKYRKEISAFDYISVRETGAYESVSHLANTEVSIVPDPVFLLHKKKWEELQARSTRKGDEYLVCYFMNKKYADKYYELACKIAKERKLKIVRLNPFFSAKSLLPNSNLDAGPIEFLSLINNANFVCTDSFHGTAFSIIFQKEFIAFDYENGNDTRKKDLLILLGLQDRLIVNDGMLSAVSNVIDYNTVDRKIRELQRNGEEFLSQMTEGEKQILGRN